MFELPRRILATLILAVTSTLLISCGNDPGYTGQFAPSGSLRMVNAVPDSPTLGFVVDDRNEANLQFDQTSTFVPELPNVPITFKVLYVENGETVTLVSTSITIEVDRKFTVVVAGTLDNPRLLMFDNPPADFSDKPDAVEIQFAHAATNAGESASLFIDTQGNPATEASAVASFGEFDDLQDVDSNTELELRVRNTGGDTDLWSAGPFSFQPGTRHLLLLVDYFGPGDKIARLLSVGPAGTAAAPNEDLPAGVRIANMTPDRGPVDVTVDDSLIAENVAFGEVTDYLETTSTGDVDVKVTPFGQPDTVISEGTKTLAAGTFHTLTLSGLADQNDVGVSVDDRRRVATRALLGVTHAAPDANPDSDTRALDVYFLQQGEDVSSRAPNTSAGFLETASLFLPEGTFDLVLTNAGTEDIVFGPLRLDIGNDLVLRAFITDAAGGGTPLEVVLSDDFSPQQ